jgi:hypothetical protein
MITGNTGRWWLHEWIIHRFSVLNRRHKQYTRHLIRKLQPAADSIGLIYNQVITIPDLYHSSGIPAHPYLCRMKKAVLQFTLLLLLAGVTYGQDSFNYTLLLEPVNITGVPGLHSYAYAQHNGKWLIVGGRLDGVHARQPFNAFPQSQNNTQVMVIDVNSQQVWTSPLTGLPTAISEQLQSTNMNFHQDGDTLLIIGGYAYSTTAADHITFPNLTTINVSATINAIINNQPFSSYIKQINNSVFAVTGGHLTKMGTEFLLVGGHRFDGRYNPMMGPTYVQTYTNEIRKFRLDNSGSQLSYSNYSAVNDPVHLHRRDYNLLPQIFPDGSEGFTISSGVFQHNFDLPFLYPVDITANGYTPITGFNQYLSNYHSAFTAIYDSSSNEMHSLFFGGISQYYYQNGTLIQDNDVPFVKTISRLTRYPDSTLTEYQLPEEMPALKGASAEFIINPTIPQRGDNIINIDAVQSDTILAGHIYGGILSTALNPFANNATAQTSADPAIYRVKLIRKNVSGLHQKLDGKNPYSITVFPNPAHKQFTVQFSLKKPVEVSYILTTAAVDLVAEKSLSELTAGDHSETISVENLVAGQVCYLTFSFDNMYYVTRKIVVE